MQVELKAKQLKIIAAVLVVVSTSTIYYIVIGRGDESIPTISSKNCVPAFLDGGGPYYKPNSPFRDTLHPEDHNGEEITITGYLFDKTCSQPISGAVIDLWQASEEGEYADSYYRAKITTDDDGFYQFKTVIPKGYGEGTGYRPPHIHFKVFIDDKEIVTSQVFFDDVRGKPGFKDQYIIQTEKLNDNWVGEHNIILPI